MKFENFRKTDIIKHLAQKFGYRNYLELCTTTTGNCYRNVDRDALNSVQRLMYQCPPSFDDAMPIDFRCEGTDINDGLAKLRETQVEIDICLVDGFHTYDETLRDLNESFKLLQDGGMLIVHDCLPPTLKSAAPELVEGEWCGVSYKAFLDFVLDHKNADYCTVNCDYGCGIIIKNRTISFSKTTGWMDAIAQLTKWRPLSGSRPHSSLITQWENLNGDHDEVFHFFDQNKKELLRLVTPLEFIKRFEVLDASS